MAGAANSPKHTAKIADRRMEILPTCVLARFHRQNDGWPTVPGCGGFRKGSKLDRVANSFPSNES
jgi:hypothetical protein